MEYDKTLPEDFEGTFYFTNWTDEDFVGVWGKKEYIFPKHSTSPMILPDQTPLEIQWIRKKFARDLAEKEYLKSENWNKAFEREQDPQGMKRLYSLHQAASYSVDELTSLIQKCLVPLERSHAKVKQVSFIPIEDKISKDENGEINTISIGPKDDIVNELKKNHETLKQKNRI